jgi:isopenicillin-N epimerase
MPVTTLKQYFLLNPQIHFLNHGSFGACPRPVFEEYQHWQRELEFQPVEFLGRRHNQLMADSRSVLSAYLGANPLDVVYTPNVTASINIVARSLQLGHGDQVLATNHEYGACDRTWRFLSTQNGFSYINQPVPVPLTSSEHFLEAFWAGVTNHTRVIFMSHITSPTAMIFPVREICLRARQQGILTVIDGAHAPGQIPLNLQDLGADFYGGNLHKWLCAPKGAGFLYARPEVQPMLKPLVVSWGYESEVPGESIFVDHHEWTGTRDISAFLAVPAAIRFQQQHDWNAVCSTSHGLVEYALKSISSLTGLPALHPYSETWFSQMGAAQLPPGVDLLKLKTRLYSEFYIEVPVIAWWNKKLIRISVQAYNDKHDIDVLIQALRELLNKQ